MFALALLPFLALPTNDVVLQPVANFSVHDEPVDGMGDSFNASPFEGLIRTQSTRADRAMLEYDLSGLTAGIVVHARLAGSVSVNNAFDNGVRTFDFGVYPGNGLADLSDYQATTVVVGSGSYHPPMQTSFAYDFDVTAQVVALLNSGATHLGVRCDGTSNPNFPNILNSGGTLTIKVQSTIGSGYCMANPNSTGAPGTLVAVGSDVASDNDVTLQAGNLPSASFGFFITSQGQGFVALAGGSQGNLCLGGSIGRYVGPGQIRQSNAAGEFALALDLTQTPTPGGLVPVAAGQTWNFQAWHRDATPQGVPTSNFTPGVEIAFQ